MKTVSFRLPDSVDLDNREALTILAAQLYKQGRLSLGQAAEVAGLSKRTFAEIEEDMRNASCHRRYLVLDRTR